VRSAADTEKNVASACVAQAFAKKVFPVPGGPYNKIPFQGVLEPINNWGNFIGRITASYNAFLAFSSPQTSSHLIFGFSFTITSSIFIFILSLSLSLLSFLTSFFSSPIFMGDF